MTPVEPTDGEAEPTGPSRGNRHFNTGSVAAYRFPTAYKNPSCPSRPAPTCKVFWSVLRAGDEWISNPGGGVANNFFGAGSTDVAAMTALPRVKNIASDAPKRSILLLNIMNLS